MITVYITNFNYGRYISSAIDSVIKQTYKNYELIIIDDGSTDSSKEIIESYKSLYPFITTIYQQNLGLNRSNNVALNRATGDYIMRLDADDILHESALEEMASVLDADEKLGLVFPDYYIVDKEGLTIRIEQRHDFDKDVTLFDQAAHGACTMIRTKYLRDLGGYDESFTCQDGYELWVKFITEHKVRNINKPLFYYRQHGENLTKNEEKILRTRAAINKKYATLRYKDQISALAIIPTRGVSVLSTKIGSENLLDIKIEELKNCNHIKKIVVATENNEVLNYVLEKYGKDEAITPIVRSAEISRSGYPIFETIDLVLSKTEHLNNFSAILLTSVDYPFIKNYTIDDTLNTMFLFNSDSIITVRVDNHLFFQHRGGGLVSIFNQDKFTRLERESLFQSVGGVSAVRLSAYINNRKMIVGKVGHVLIDQLSAISVLSEFDLRVANLLQERNN